MNEIIKVNQDGYAEYEELLLKRDKALKEADYMMKEYINVFGELVTDVFSKKIECIKKKKLIALIQAALNKGEAVDLEAINKTIKEEIKEYNDQLDTMLKDLKEARGMKSISASTLREIKSIYRRLAKLIHPDINPKTEQIPELITLWHMIVISYRANDLTSLKEAEILVNKVLKDNGLEGIEIEIPDLEEKIAKLEDEIAKIMTTNPYQYKYFLQDEAAVKTRKDELLKEQKEYEDYEKELDETLKGMMEGGASFVWQMK